MAVKAVGFWLHYIRNVPQQVSGDHRHESCVNLERQQLSVGTADNLALVGIRADKGLVLFV